MYRSSSETASAAVPDPAPPGRASFSFAGRRHARASSEYLPTDRHQQLGASQSLQSLKAGPRLLKKTRKSSPFASHSPSPQPYEEPQESTVWTSHEDLKRPETRQQTREQLTGTFPGTATPTPSTTMPFRNRSAKRADLQHVAEVGEAISSTSSVDSSGLRKLAEKGEKDITTVDVEQAVTLLEELKKVATPEQLVSLHKALLPTKDVETVTNPANALVEEQLASRLTRQRSNLPPGLATRGGASNDLLRKPPSTAKLDTYTPSRRKDVATDDSWISPMPSIDSIATNLTTPNPIPLRAPTPSEQSYLHAGAYGHGTLRITNGYASPDPSIYGDHFDVQAARSDEGYLTSSERAPIITESRPSSKQEVLQAMAQTFSPVISVTSPKSVHGIQTPLLVDEPTPVEPLRIRERSWSTPQAPQDFSARDYYQKQQSSQRNISPLSSISFTEFQEQCPSVDISPLTSPETDSVRGETDQSWNQTDDVSPISNRSIPRYQQRWSQRTSDVANLNLARHKFSLDNSGPKSSPLHSFRTRLSTVNDEDLEFDEAENKMSLARHLPPLPDTPAHFDNPYAPSIADTEQNDDEESENLALHSSYKEVMAELQVRARSKHDSGYESDEPDESAKHTKGLNPKSDRSETSTIADASSVYNVQEFLQLQARQPEERGSAKNNSPFLRSGKPTGMETTPTETSPLSPLSPISQSRLNARMPNKLQKAMPANVRARMQMEIDTRVQKAQVESSPIPPVSPEIKERMRTRAISSPIEHALATQENVSPSQSGAPTPEEMKRQSYFPRSHALSSPPESVGQSLGDRRGDSYFSGPTSIQGQRMRPRSKTTAAEPVAQPLKPAKPPKTGMMNHIRNLSGGRPWGKENKKEIPKPEEDDMPAYMDLSSVSRTLGTGSYDIATAQAKHNSRQSPPKDYRQIDSPYAITTGMSKFKTSQGMNEAAAAEFARNRSRDVAGLGMHAMDERPRMAIPRRRDQQTATQHRTVSVEDRFPDWHGKPSPTLVVSEAPPMAHNRPNSMYAESVPSMPDTDGEAIAQRAEGMLAERRQMAARGPRPPPHSSHGPVTRASRVAVDEQRRPQSSPMPDPNNVALSEEAERLQRWQDWRVSLGVMDGDDESTPSPEDRPTFLRTQTEPSPAIVVSRYITPIGSMNARATDTAAQHADLYRDLIDEDDMKSPMDQIPARTDSANSFSSGSSTSSPDAAYTGWRPPPSRQPSIPYKGKDWQIAAAAVPRAPSPGGRVWTESGSWVPFSPNHAAMAEQRSRAASLHSSNPLHRHSERSLTNSYVEDDNRNNTSNTATPRAQRPRHVRAESSVASLGSASIFSSSTGHSRGAFPSPTKRSSDRHSPTRSYFDPRAPHAGSAGGPRPKASFDRGSIIGSFVSYDSNSRASTPNSLATPGSAAARHQRGSSDSLFDRYSGGMAYGWNKEKGFGGSAGTRSKGNEVEYTKAVPMGAAFGLDLSDVPVFLKKAR